MEFRVALEDKVRVLRYDKERGMDFRKEYSGWSGKGVAFSVGRRETSSGEGFMRVRRVVCFESDYKLR